MLHDAFAQLIIQNFNMISQFLMSLYCFLMHFIAIDVTMLIERISPIISPNRFCCSTMLRNGTFNIAKAKLPESIKIRVVKVRQQQRSINVVKGPKRTKMLNDSFRFLDVYLFRQTSDTHVTNIHKITFNDFSYLFICHRPLGSIIN